MVLESEHFKCISLYKPMLNEADFIFMRKLYKPCPKDAVCHISEYLECQFTRRTFSKIHQILPLFAPYGALIGASTFDLHTL